MSRIFITGDTHGSLELKKLSNKNFPIATTLTKEDIVIICGDAGFMWDNSKETKYWDDWAEDRPFTIISVFGNHSNYELLRAIPLTEWHGAKVRKVRPHVMYVENGEIFTFNNQTFFCMGGAASHDKIYRKEHETWWADELPSMQEYEHAVDNLSKHNDKIDYVLSHCAPNHILNYERDPLTTFLENYIWHYIDFKYHFCGHYHKDKWIEPKMIMVYNNFWEITSTIPTVVEKIK